VIQTNEMKFSNTMYLTL